jgi:hypothetical protein
LEVVIRWKVRRARFWRKSATRAALPEGKMSEDHTGSWENRRRSKRKYLLFKIPAYDAQTRRFLGLVQDITEDGVQLFGVKMETECAKTLIIQASDYVRSAPLHFNAICRWTRRENPQGYYVSGFEIVEISEEARANLIKLMEFVALG